MRSEIHEPGRGMPTSASMAMRGAPGALYASVVDAALSDDQTFAAPTANTRRDMPATAIGADAVRVAVDCAHPSASATADDGLLRQLSRQLELLEVQQRQIRRLLEQTEQRSARSVTRLDR